MSLISIRLAAICFTFSLTAALSAQTIADAARTAQNQRDKAKTTPTQTYTNQSLPNDPAAPKTTPLPVDQSGKQFITLFDVRGVGNSGGVNQTVIVTGRGYTGTLEDRRRSGMKAEPGEDEFVSVTVANAKDPKLSGCMNLLIAEVFMEHVVQIGGDGRVEPRPANGPHLPPTLNLNALSECTAVPRR